VDPLTSVDQSLRQAPDATVRAEQVRLLYGSSLVVLINLVNAPITAMLLWPIYPGWIVVGWIGLLIVTIAARVVLWRRYHRCQPTDQGAERWGRNSTLGSFATGCLWGLLGSIVFVTDNPAYYVLVVFVLGGMTAGAAMRSSAHLPAFYGFAVPAILPFVVALLAKGNFVFGGMGLMLLAFAAVLVLVGRDNNRRISENIRLGIEQAILNKDLQRATAELKQEIKSRNGAEAFLHATLRRTSAQLEIVGRLSQIESLGSSDVEAFARQITEFGAQTTGCERVNAWLFSEDESELHCIDLYELSSGKHSAGMTLKESQFRNEFHVLRTNRYVDADNPLTDPRTAGYVETYLKPLRITAMLDAVIHTAGRNLGLLCFEHVDRPHHWEQDEITFASQLADKIGLVLLNRMRRQAEDELRVSETRFRTIFNSVSDAIFAHDPLTGAFLDVNMRATELFGYSRDELLRGDVGMLSIGTPPFTQADALIRMAAATGVDAPPFEWRFKRRDGMLFWGDVSVRRTTFGANDVVLAVVRDISERKRTEEEMRRMARHDILTGLPNRAVFVEALQQAMSSARRGGRSFAVLYLDLDHFKDVNDTLGHPIGDLLLQSVSQRLQATIRDTDTVARFGGDEFAVVQTDIREPAEAAVLADKILKALSEPFSILGNEIRTGTSVGIAVYGPDSPHAETLLSQADVALYRAKSEGRGTYRYFTDAMDSEVRTRVTLANELREAIGSGQLSLMYQPQVDASTGRVTGLEALVRWRHPQRGLVAPGEFIPIAEKSGLIVALGHWVLNEACRQMKEWLDAGIAPPLVAVNVSALQFKTSLELENDIAAILAKTALPPQLLELELTESVLMGASRKHNDVLLRLRKAGLRIAIDDFGTGYSSLEYLGRFPVDRIKIAQAFMIGLTSTSSNAAIVKAAIGLARELKLNVIVEGVETAEQLRLIKSWGCQEVQGYYASKPLSALETAAFLRARRPTGLIVAETAA
jgi:diguanylate cyclase (GGDEF)-like protein/PAS domain S-box-containing protein